MVYPDSTAVWQAYLASGKRHLLLTGARQSGKSTLMRALLPADTPSVITWAEPRCAVYLHDSVTGETAPIGLFDSSIPGNERKMRSVEDGFLSVGIPALERMRIHPADWIAIDEIGYLESVCPAYCAAILRCMEEKRVLAVVRKGGDAFCEQLLAREDAYVVDLDDA